jgi:hypothetical protein
MITHNRVEQHPPLTGLSPRPNGGFFINCTSLKKTDAELTKVNNCILTHSSTMLCKYPILLIVKPAHHIVNKPNTVSSMKPIEKTSIMNKMGILMTYDSRLTIIIVLAH